MDWQAGAWLFWGSQKVQIAAIQMLPVIPVNEVSKKRHEYSPSHLEELVLTSR